jgi:guanylate kinase
MDQIALQQLIAAYRPSASTLERLRTVDLVGIVGPSASGKTTLIEQAMELDRALRLVIVDTSRPPRPGERDGVDYYFRTQAEMLQRIERREYVQVAPSVLGDLYATAPESYTTQGIAVMAIIADAMPVFRALPFKTLRSVFVVPPSWDVWQTRLLQHDFTSDQLAKRFAEARHSFTFALTDPATTIVVNDDLTTAAQAFLSLTRNESPASDPVSRQQGREIVTSMLARLETA